MNAQELSVIRSRIERIRKQSVASPLDVIPASVDYLDREIKEANAEDKKLILYALIYSECARFRLHDLEMRYRRQEERDLPENPMTLASLAATLMFDDRTQPEAVLMARKAVAAAKKRGAWIRHCLTLLARVAIAAGEDDVLEEALKGLVEDGGQWRKEDYHFEVDFLDRIEPGQVDPILLEAYRALVQSDSRGSS